MKSTILFALACASGVLASLPVFGRAACANDNCARSVTGTVRGSAGVAAQRSDCSSFMIATYTPATSTLTSTAAAQTVYSSTATITITSGQSTSTITITHSTSAQVPSTVTETLTVTSILIDNSCTSSEDTSGVTLQPRQVETQPTVVPLYASFCSGTSRYSSACSCWGITRTTTTIAAPQTTTVQTPTVTKITTTTVIEASVTTLTTTV